MITTCKNTDAFMKILDAFFLHDLSKATTNTGSIEKYSFFGRPTSFPLLRNIELTLYRLWVS